MRIFFIIFCLIFAIDGFAQGDCPKWTSALDSIKIMRHRDEYRTHVKTASYKEAVYFWKYIYTNAPGAFEGLYIDGVKLYKKLYEEASSLKKRKEYENQILAIYNKRISCYPQKKGYILARKGYDMYTFQMDYKDVYDVLKKAIYLEDDQTPAFVITPFAEVTNILHTQGIITTNDLDNSYETLFDIANNNIANGVDDASDYETSLFYIEKYLGSGRAELRTYSRLNDKIELGKDCAYYIEKVKKQIEANKDNPIFLQKSYQELREYGCPETNEYLASLEERQEALKADLMASNVAKTTNSGSQADLEINRGNYAEAIKLYRASIGETNDKIEQATLLLQIADVQYSKQSDKTTAKATALEALEIVPNFGAAYLFIGDMYAASTKQCYSDDAFLQKLVLMAAIDKWEMAKSVDASVSNEATERIKKHRGKLPTKSEIYLQKSVKEGKTFKIECWINEKVKVVGR